MNGPYFAKYFFYTKYFFIPNVYYLHWFPVNCNVQRNQKLLLVWKKFSQKSSLWTQEYSFLMLKKFFPYFLEKYTYISNFMIYMLFLSYCENLMHFIWQSFYLKNEIAKNNWHFFIPVINCGILITCDRNDT